MSKKESKRYKSIVKDSKEKRILALEEAIKKVKQNCTTKFDESIDVSIRLNLKQKKEEINLRTVVNLPNGNGKKVRIAVLCEDNKINEAKNSGAEIVGSDDLINDITSGKINFDKFIATPTMMPKMGKLGKILGPKGLMPNPKLGTITNDKDGNIGASIGKKSFSDNKIIENFNSLMQTIQKEKPSVIKGDFILSSFITSTMGISYQLKVKA